MSIVKRKRRGYYVERKLVRLLSKKPGNYVFRVPVSGSRASDDAIVAFPDVFLVNNAESRIVAFEVKSTVKNKVRVKREQIEKLAKFLNPFKLYKRREAVIAVWFFNPGKWVFRRVDGLLTEEYLVVKVDDESNWTP